MIITCPRCLAAYTVPDSALGAQGRKVRCSSCHFEWQEASPPQNAIANLAPQRAPAPSAGTAPPAKTESKKPKPPAPVKPKSEASSSPAAVIAFVILAALLAGLVMMRNSISNAIPAMEAIYESVGLPVGSPAEWFVISGKGVESAEDGNRFTLTVHGDVENVSKRPRDLPPVRISWISKDGQVGAVTTVRASPEHLEPGGKATFTGTLRRVDTSLGGEVRMVPWLGSEDMVVTPEMEADKPAHAAAPHSAPAPSHEPAASEGHH